MRTRPLLLGTLLVAAAASPVRAEPPLVAAARGGDAAQVRALLAAKADVNAPASDGSRALLWAVHRDDAAITDLLIAAGADPNAANDYKLTPLSAACANASAPIVTRLLKAGANPDTPIATGETPLMTCAATGEVDAVSALVAAGARVNAAEPSLNQTALMWAVSEGHLDVVRTLVRRGADVRAATRHGFTPLHFAAREGRLDIARLLLDAGVDVDVRSTPDPTLKGRGPAFDAMRSGGSTPLVTATVRGQVPMALFLLERGADPNAADTGFTPLHWASGTWEGDLSNPMFGYAEPMSGIPDRTEKIALIRALLARGANPNARITRRLPGFAGGYAEPVGATPFFLAASVADVEVMRLLVAAGAEPGLKTQGQTSALMAASGVNRKLSESSVTEAQSIEAARYLLELGADATHISANGENALFGPAYRGWNALVRLLVDHGAAVNTVSKAGITPWLTASGQGDRFGGVLYNHDTAELLASLGANPTLGKPCQAQGKCR